MASKGKGKIKLKKHEIEFDKKVIDLKRFAYDIMKYTAIKFRVPESCIAVWDGPANDYGYDDFCSVVSRKVIQASLAMRYQCYEVFSKHYERNKLANQDLINRLLQEVINKETDKCEKEERLQVRVSLAVLCELFIFLYSEDLNLCPKRLATHWFHCYLNVYKKQFENSGGLEIMYRACSIQLPGVNKFVNQFIEDHCLPYKTTANDPGNEVLFVRSLKKQVRESEKEAARILGTVKPATEMAKSEHSNIELQRVTVPFDEASRTNIPPNTDFGTPRKLLQLFDSSVASPKGKSRHRRWSSHKRRFKREIEDEGVDLLANPGHSVPLPHEMCDSAFPVDASQSQKLPEVSDQELSTHTKRSSHGERSKKPSSRTGVEQGFGQPSSDSSETKKPIVTRTPPKDPSVSSPEEQPQHQGTLRYKQRMKMIKSGSRANVEQAVGKLDSDAYEMKQSSRKTPSTPGTLVPSQNPSETSPEEELRIPKLFTDERVLKLLRISDDESPATSNREETSGGDLPLNPGLGSLHEIYDFLLDNVDDISECLTNQIIQEISKPAEGSRQERRNRKPSLLESEEQGLSQPSSDSSRTEKSPKDPSATNSEEQSRHPMIGDEGIAKILSICEEESLTYKRGETSEINLLSNPGLDVRLPQEMYNFPLIDVAELSQNLQEQHVQETSKQAGRLSYRERRDRKPSLRARVEQGLEQPRSDSSETNNLVVTRTVTSPKGPAVLSPEEQPRDHRTVSYQQKMVECGLRANVEQCLEQPSSDSYEMKQSSRKTPSVPRTLVPPQDTSATSSEEQPRRPRNLTDEQIAKILRNLTDEEIARLLSISEEPPITSERNETSEVDLPSNPGIGVPLPQEMHDFPLIDVAKPPHNLPEDNIQETSNHARRLSDLERKLAHLERRLSQLERRDEKPSSRDSVEQDLEHPRLDSSETKNPIVIWSVSSPKDSSATSPEQPRRPEIEGEKIAKILSISEEESLASKREETTEVGLPSNPGSGLPLPQEICSSPFPAGAKLKVPETYGKACGLKTGMSSLCLTKEPGLGQPNSDSATATDTTQSYERLGAKPKVRVENAGSSWFAEAWFAKSS